MAYVVLQFSATTYNSAWGAAQDAGSSTQNVVYDNAALSGAPLQVGDAVFYEDGGNLGNPSTTPVQNGFYLCQGSPDTVVQIASGDVSSIIDLSNATTTTTTTTLSTTTTSTTTTTTEAPTIEWNDSSAFSTSSAATTLTRSFTITNNSTNFTQSDILGLPNWITVSQLSTTTQGGTITFSIAENSTTDPRNATIELEHPEHNGVNGVTTDPDIVINQAAGDAMPTAPDFSKTVQYNTVGGTAQFTLDFSNASGWVNVGGSSVQDTESSFANDDLKIQIIEIPGNIEIYDNAASATQLTQVANPPYELINQGGAPTLLISGTSWTGTVSWEYQVEDSAGNTVTGQIQVTLQEPANQAPNATDANITPFVNDTTGLLKYFSRAATDDGVGGGSTVFEWWDNTGSQTLTLGQLNNSLQYGSVSQASGESWIYTPDASSVRQFGDPTLTEVFYFKATDQDGTGLSDAGSIGTVTITMLAPGNERPTFSVTSGSDTMAQYTQLSQTITATDLDGDPLTFSILQAPAEGELTLVNPQSNEVTWNYNANGAAGTVTFQLQVTDSKNESALTPFTMTINVTASSAVLVNASLFQANSNDACAATKDQPRYLDTAQAQSVDQLEVGDKIYLDTDFNTPLVSTNQATRWVAVVQPSNPTVSRAIEIDNEGAIVSIVECQVSLGNAWPIIVSYDEDVIDLCQGSAEYSYQEVYQNISTNATLADVYTAGGQLFNDIVVANIYLGNTAPSEFTVPSGYYNDAASSAAGEYYEFQQGSWIAGTNTNGSNPCPAEINYQTYNVGVYYNNVDRDNLDNICLANSSDLIFTKLYFRGNILDNISQLSEEDKLQYLLQNNLVIFTSQEGADAVDYDLTWDNTVFLSSTLNGGTYSLPAERKFAIWENYNSSGYSGNFTWKGADSTGLVLRNGGDSSTFLAECSIEFERPTANSIYCQGLENNACTSVDGVATSRENVFYAFLSCVTRFEDGSPYWNLYVVDGLHKDEINASSYIEQLIEEIGAGATLGGQSMLECVTLQHKVLAVNIDDAQDILNSLDQYSATGAIRPVQINAVDLGLTSNATVRYGYADCAACLMDTGSFSSFTLATVDDAEIINTSIPNFDLEKNYELDDVSKPLLRTNPKLSTNAKLVVNSAGEMYLEAIEASKELASVEYKKWPINKEGQWSYDLHKFFKNTKTPSDLIYQAKESYSNFAVQETFENQIEEDYHYGTVYNYSKIYNEDFRMLAPIWLDKNIPSKFVIFRVKDPVGTLDFDTRSNLDNIKEVLKNSEIIKTYDLSRKSALGTYLRNHIQSESFPKTPITMNFDKTQRSSFNGIDLDKGGFSSKGEYLDNDLIRQDSTLISANELITSGFERNKLACANLINLEFLFDDDSAADYSINRYFGLYVNDIDSGYGTLESAAGGRLKFKTLNSYINSESSSAIPPYKLISETPTLGYAATSDKFYRISPKVLYNTADLEVNVEDSNNSIASEIRLAETGNSVDIKVNGDAGSDFVKVTVIDTPAVNDGFAIFPSKEQTYRIKFTRLVPQQQVGQEGWNFTIVNPADGNLLEFGPIYVTQNGIQGVANYIKDKIAALDGFGQPLYPELDQNLEIEVESDRSIILAEKRASLKPLQPDFVPVSAVTNSIVRVEELQVPYDIDNNTFFALEDLPAGGFGGVNFSNQGTIPQITSAIVKSINSVDNGFTALSYDGADHFYIKTDVQGYRLLSAGIAVPNNNANQWISVDANNLDVNNELRLDINSNSGNTINNSSIYYFSGGNQEGKSVLVTLDSVADININDSINTKARGVYNKVIDIVDDIERLPLQYKKVILEKTNTIESGEVKTYADNLVKLGLFSAFDIHDMNFDFYDTANSNLKELVYETPANIAYEPELDDSNDIYPFGDKDNTEYTIDPVSYFSGLNDILLEEQSDEFDENQITSEFDRLQENYLKEYAIRSRVVPSINKWVLKDSLTVREQPYYLNVNEAFGRSNFAPDLTANGRNRLGMTHEWFYINNLPAYFKQNVGSDNNPVYRLNDSFSYINFMDNFEITPSLFKDTNYNYFDRFFVTEGFEIKGDNNYKTFVKTNRQKKYTKVDGGNNTGFANTIFKGLKFTFKTRKEFSADNPVDFIKSAEFNGYKFSTLLNVKVAQESNGIEYEIIQNKKFKFVVFLITLSLDDLWVDGTVNRKLLYELNHSLVWKQEDLTFDYSDIKVDGALDLYNANLTNSSADDYLVIKGYEHADGSLPQFLEQINKDEDSAFGNILVKMLTPFGELILKLKIARLDGQDTLVLSEPPTDINDNPVNLQNIPVYLQSQAEYTYERGGINAYKSILDALAAKDVSEMLLRNPSEVKFTTVENNGTLSNNKFVVTMEDGTEVIKESYVVTIPDTDKPESFKLFTGNIGYNLDDGFTYYPFLIRQNGNYTVDTRPVVTFTDIYSHMKTNTLQSTVDTTEILLEEQMYKHSLTDVDEINLAKDYYKRYNRCGVAFNLGFIYDGGTHDSAWGYIKNHFYRKVNEFNAASVTKLSTSTDKLPLYPLIGEIAIDKKDVHVFKSSWDKNYYTRSLSGGGIEQVPGTFETKEERSYLASTIMKIKDSYTLLEFTQQVVESEEEQDQILIDDNSENDLVIFEGDDRIVIDFYITKKINTQLSTDGVFNAIQQYVAVADSAEDKTTLLDDAQLYIEENLVNLFSLNQIKLFTRRAKGESSALESVATIDALDDGGYTQDQNFTFKAHEQKPLNFRLIYNKRLGYSYRIRPMIKITS